MKTRLIISIAVILTAISTFAVAGGLFTAPWRGALLQVEQVSQKNVADDVSVLLPKMQGIQTDESAYLDDDKAIYVSRPNDLDEKTSRKKVADNAEHIFDQHGTSVLFGKNLREGDETGGYDLWVIDVVSGMPHEFSVGAVNSASVDPSGNMVAASSLDSFKISLLTKDGVFLKQIAEHGLSPVFSPDSKFIAYAKLANGGLDSGLGIAIYNLNTGEETLLTHEKEDYEPLLFSSDGKKLYFNSGRGQGLITDQYKGEPFQTPLWFVDLVSKKTKQLNNRDEKGGIVFVQRGSVIASSDGSVIASATGDGLSVIKLSNEGVVVSAKVVGQGGLNPRWLKKDEVITYSAQGIRGKYWEFVSIK